MPRFGQKSPHPFLLKKMNLPVKTRAASPQPFMFQYVCRSPIIRLHFMHAAPAAVEKCRFPPTFADVRSTPALVSRSLPTSGLTNADSWLLLPNAAAFRLTLPTESIFILYIRLAWCYMYSSRKRRVNAKTLPPMSGQTSRGRP